MTDAKLDSILDGRRSQPQQLIEVLQDVQECYGYIPETATRSIAQALGIPLMEVYRVASFYKAFSLTPRGKNLITICMGTACHVRGAKLLPNQVSGQLGISPGGTTKDGEFTVEQVNCLGACVLGPVVVMNETYHHHTTPKKLRTLIDETYENKTGDTSHASAQKYQ